MLKFELMNKSILTTNYENMYLCSYLEFVTYVMNNIEIQSVLDLKHFMI